MILSKEIKELGFHAPQAVAGGCAFTGNAAHLYEANLQLRTATRIVIRLAEFHADSFHELERRSGRIAWEEYISPASRIRLRVTCRKSRLYHSDAVAERIATAMGKRVSGLAFSSGADESEDDADEESALEQLFLVRLADDNCVISMDSSGPLLHRRGYRQAAGKAPLRETLAAAMVMSSGWEGTSPLIDPLCGSGTIPIEAAMIARKIPPGLNRRFAFETWPTFDVTLWETVKANALQAAQPGATVTILASDRDDGVVKIALENAERAGVADGIQFHATPISAIEPPATPGWLITNPPYGVRVGERSSLRNLYAQLGNVVRSKAPAYTVCFLSADRALESAPKLRLEEVFRTRNGGIPVRFMKGSVR